MRETRKSTIIAFLAWTVEVYDFILFGTLLPRAKEDFGWSSSHARLISTFVSIGTAIVVLGVGPLVDRLGRRKGMMITVGGTALSSATTAASGGAFSLVAAKSIGGIGLSEQVFNATYLNEIYSPSLSEFEEHLPAPAPPPGAICNYQHLSPLSDTVACSVSESIACHPHVSTHADLGCDLPNRARPRLCRRSGRGAAAVSTIPRLPVLALSICSSAATVPHEGGPHQ
ncbi:MFS transporter [Rhodococcus koreensis]